MMQAIESSIFYYNDEGRPKDLVKLLAVIDEVDSPDVDTTEIWKTNTDKYALLTASGCSCWDGDYNRKDFGTLELLALALFREDFQYNPSLRGALTLLRQVFENDK